MKHATPLRGEAHRGASGPSTRERWRVPAALMLTLAVLSGVLIASGSAAQAQSPGTTVPSTEPEATTTTTTPATEPDATTTTTTPVVEPSAEPPAAPTAVAPTDDLQASVPCEGFWKNFWFGSNSVTGTVTIGDKGQRVAEHTVTFEVTSTATETCTVYAQIFTYDGPGELPQTAVATATIVLEPGETETVELTTSECRVQADLLLKEYETVQWPGMNWDDVIAYDTSTCPPPPPCQTSNGTEVQPGYAVLDGDHVLARSASPSPEKVAFVAYALPGAKAPADNNDLTAIVGALLGGMDLFGQPVLAGIDNCASVPVPECRGFAIIEIDATATPLPRIFFTVSPKVLEILGKTGLDLTKLLDIANIDVEAVLAAFSTLSEEDQTTFVTELLNQPGLAMNFYSVNWFSVPECPPEPETVAVAVEEEAPAQQVGVLAEAVTPSQVLPATGANTASTVGLALFVVLMGLGLCVLARSRRVR